ncbi:MAG: M6 family metalloprotease domain-containing protein [Prevotellaceae bacterium]|nr:M6 family metalloprotease domain-containing protein [Prevotellaceae bacterium]
MNRRLTATLLASLTALSAAAQSDIADWLKNKRPEHYETVSFSSEGMQRSRRNIGSQATAPLSSTGEQRVPVILVAFKDKAFTVADSTEAGVNEFYEKFCNGTMDGQLYTEHGSHGSVRDYFAEQSDSVFFPLFTVIGPVTLSKGYASYGANSSSRKDTGYNEFCSEALTMAQSLYEGSWSDFDNDGNGTVDMVFFIYAGLGESNGGDDDCLWPKESSSSTTINETTYACSGATCELRPSAMDDEGNVLATKADGVGVFIHELSHALGLPDFYDTNNVAFGMDLWSVMDYGNYGNNGYNPGNYTAYERDFMGWRQLVDLEEPAVLTISCFADGGFGYRITNDENADEYYVIENRQAKGWDDKICGIGHGLQVTHVDYNASRWNNNTVNTDPDHQRMTIIAANNNYNGTNSAESAQEWQECLEGNLYPGASLNYSLTDVSTPAATVYTGELLGKPITDITENDDGTVTLCFRTNGKLETPEPEDAEETDDGTVELSWPQVENATYYICELYKGELLLRTDTVSDTAISYDDLPVSNALSYRLMACADTPYDYVSSDWSEPSFFDKTVSAITGISESELTVYVYTAGGVMVTRCHGDELGRLSLRPGIYIARYSNGSTKKFVLR